MGAEALVRWQHPALGLISPAEVISVAEETGLILPLGHWVLNTACQQLAAWSKNPNAAHLTLAVNISARQISLPTFVEEVRQLVSHTKAPIEKLKLELTESLLLAITEYTIKKMLELKSMGVGFSLDDFGTGYSSLSYLKRLPIDQLKIDRSFVRDLLTDTNDAVITRTIVALGNSLGLDVIAEGVETEAQKEFLASVGCHSFQGNLIGRPLPLQEFEEYLSRVSVGESGLRRKSA
jgi:EAL domain-containing protein (putative c-di-GMP-specific phosphodiesterase class I)